MIVKFLRPVYGMAYFGFETADIPDDKAAKLVSEGAAIMIPETEGTENNLPEGLPFREVLYNAGFDTVTDILNAADTLTGIKGITSASAKKILAFLNNL